MKKYEGFDVRVPLGLLMPVNHAVAPCNYTHVALIPALTEPRQQDNAKPEREGAWGRLSRWQGGELFGAVGSEARPHLCFSSS